MRAVRSGLELRDRDLVLLVGAGEHLDGSAVGEADGLGVRGPVRRGQQHLVTRVHHGLEGLVDGLLAAVGDDDLAGGDLETGVAQRLRGDRLAQRRKTRSGRVPVARRVGQRSAAASTMNCGVAKVGLAGGVRDDVLAFGLEGLGLGVDLEGRGLGDGGQLAGERERVRSRLRAYSARCGGSGCGISPRSEVLSGSEGQPTSRAPGRRPGA